MCASVSAYIYICTYACHYVCGCRCLYVFDNVCMYAYAYIYLFMNISGATSSWGHWIYRHICAQNICLDSVYLINCLLKYYQRIQNVCKRISRSMCLKPTFYIFQHTWCLDCVYLLISHYHVINEIKMYVKALGGLCVLSLRFIFPAYMKYNIEDKNICVLLGVIIIIIIIMVIFKCYFSGELIALT